jgi:polygalacturonase
MVFSIQDFGAIADGQTLNSAAIQKAIDACHTAGGGRVICGPGTWLTGSLLLKSGVDLHLEQGCRLLGSPRAADYADFDAPGFIKAHAPEHCSKSLIRAVESEDIAISGPGEINGNGLSFFNTAEMKWTIFFTPHIERPRLFMALKCRRVRLEDVSFMESPSWTVWLMKCEDVRVHRITISADQRMINNDGIDFDACRNVIVSDSRFKTADDCIVLRSIQQVFDEPGICENITVSNCVLDSWCQGVRIGCPGDHIIRNAVFANLVIHSRGNGILFENPKRYLPEGNPGSADISNIRFSNVTIECVYNPIKINVEEGIALKRLEGFGFSGFRIKSGGPIQVQGNARTIIRDVTFSDIRIESSGDDAILCRHCSGVTLNNVSLSNKTATQTMSMGRCSLPNLDDIAVSLIIAEGEEHA